MRSITRRRERSVIQVMSFTVRLHEQPSSDELCPSQVDSLLSRCHTHTHTHTHTSLIYRGISMLATPAQKLEGTHRVRIHALLLTQTLTLTFDLSTQNHVTCRISQDHSLYHVWTLWVHSFLTYTADKQRDRQTNKQTDSNILPTPTDIVGVSNYN